MHLYNILRFQNLQQFWRYLPGIQALFSWIFILHIFLQIVILISRIFLVLTFLQTTISISWLFLIRMNPVMMLQTWKISFRAYFKDDITEQWQIRKYSYCVWYCQIHYLAWLNSIDKSMEICNKHVICNKHPAYYMHM